MKWYDNLYVGESLIGKEKKIKWKITHNAGTIDVYVIAFASNADNLLDIIPSWELMQKAYPKKHIHVIGLARGYEEALAVVRDIIQETYEATGDVKVKEYLSQKGRQVS